MKCQICNKEFHWCSSCGFIPEVELGCCSVECVNVWASKATPRELAEVLYHGNVHFESVRIAIANNKQAVGTELVDIALEDL